MNTVSPLRDLTIRSRTIGTIGAIAMAPTLLPMLDAATAVEPSAGHPRIHAPAPNGIPPHPSRQGVTS